jgi:hypothetical protein
LGAIFDDSLRSSTWTECDRVETTDALGLASDTPELLIMDDFTRVALSV